MSNARRPLSPHLSVYKFEITMVMSIMHRITGVGLYIGAALLVVWLGAAAYGGAVYDWTAWLAASLLGQLALFALTWALFNHLLGGMRHFLWDFGFGFSRPERFGMAWATLIGGLVLTVLVWVFFVWL